MSKISNEKEIGRRIMNLRSSQKTHKKIYSELNLLPTRGFAAFSSAFLVLRILGKRSGFIACQALIT
jgi:hypothetical protein